MFYQHFGFWDAFSSDEQRRVRSLHEVFFPLALPHPHGSKVGERHEEGKRLAKDSPGGHKTILVGVGEEEAAVKIGVGAEEAHHPP